MSTFADFFFGTLAVIGFGGIGFCVFGLLIDLAKIDAEYKGRREAGQSRDAIYKPQLKIRDDEIAAQQVKIDALTAEIARLRQARLDDGLAESLARNGLACPHCRAIDGQPHDRDGIRPGDDESTACQGLTCAACAGTWHRVFKLADVTAEWRGDE